MERRKFMGLAGIGAVAALGGCSAKEQNVSNKSANTVTNRSLQEIRPKHRKRVVVVGGGFAGLNTAASIMSNDLERQIEVIVVERNPNYFVCPMSNTLLSGDPYFKRDMFMFDYSNVQKEYGYEVMQAEVVDIDRQVQRVFTSKGFLTYDLLVLAPGIEYDYKTEFPEWSDAKIRQAKMEAPGGLTSDVGVEHMRLIQQLEAFKASGGEGVIAIIPPRPKLTYSINESVPHKSLQRCKPAPYERACMIGNWIKKSGLVGKAKVVILDNSHRPQAKSVAFEQVFSELYDGIIDYVGGFDLMDVDFDKKEIIYRGINDDADYVINRMSYDILNLVPLQKASSLIALAGLKTNSWGGAVLAKRKFYSVSDDRVYVLGDSAFYGKGIFRGKPKQKAGIPAAAQTAYSSAKVAGCKIAERLLRGKDIPIDNFSASCFSMVRSDSKRCGIAIYKDFEFTDSGFIIDEEVPKIDGKYYNDMAGEGLLGWFEGVTADTFATFLRPATSLT